MSLNPPEITPAWVIAALRMGKAVTLEAPGWADTDRGPCPHCQKPVQHFRRAPELLFEYGFAFAHPHKCNRPLELFDCDESPGFLREQRRQAQDDASSRAGEWRTEVSYDGVPNRGGRS